MNMQKFREGQAIHFDAGGRELYGIVMRACDEYLAVVQVLPKSSYDARSICYNEPDAKYDLHRDNVKLRGCPPPFTDLISRSDKGVFAYANMKKLHKLSKEKCEEYDVKLVDDGFLLTDDMMRELRNHPWNDDLHLEKSGSIRNTGRIYGERYTHRQGLDISYVDDSSEYSL